MAHWNGDSLAKLRGAVFRRDGAAGVELLRARPMAAVLQYAGDVLIAALGQEERDAAEYAHKCLEELSGRDWPGDAELAHELAVALGLPVGLDELVPVPVDLGELADGLDGDPGLGAFVVDLVAGAVLPVSGPNGEHTGVVEPAFDEWDPAYDPDRWLEFWPDGDREALDRAEFTGGTEAWPIYREERARGRARAWLAARGYRAAS